MLVAMHGMPAAMAWSKASGRFSFTDGRTKASARSS